MFDFETKLRHWRSLRPSRRGAAGKRSKRQRTTAFEFLEERCCPSAVTPDTWTGLGGDNLYSTAANWSNGVPNNGQSVMIGNSAAVTMDISPTIDNLTIAAGSSLSIADGQDLTMAGAGGSTISNAGSIQLNGGAGSNTFLYLDANTMLQGGGTVTLSTASGGGSTFIEQGVGGVTLTNNSTIQGNGLIGNGLTLVNQAGGTVNASGGTLSLYTVVSLKNSTINEHTNTISKSLNLLDAGHLPSGSYRGG